MRLISSLLILLSFNLHGSLTSKEKSLKQIQQDVGKHIGYLIGFQLEGSEIDMNDVISGIRIYQKKENPTFDRNTLRSYFLQIEEKKHLLEAQEALKFSEDYLNERKNDVGVIEIIPDKLYFKKLEAGTGEIIEEKGLFHLTCTTAQGEVLLDTWKNKTPVVQDLEDCIPGFAKAVAGMQEKERRILYIHPSLAYEDFALMRPNRTLIIDVKLLSTKVADFHSLLLPGKF